MEVVMVRILAISALIVFASACAALAADKTMILKDAFIDGGCLPQDKQCGFMTDKGEMAGFVKSSPAGKKIMPVVNKCNNSPIQPRFTMTVVVDKKFMIKDVNDITCTHSK